MSRFFVESWRRAAGDTAVLLVIVQLPIAMLHDLPSWLRHMTSWEIVKDVALVIVVYAALAACLGLAVAAVATALRAISQRAAELWAAICVFLYLPACLFGLSIAATVWWSAARKGIEHLAGISLPGLSRPALAAAALLLIIGFWRRGVVALAHATSGKLRPAHRPVAWLASASAVLALTTGYAAVRPFGWTQDAAARAPVQPDAPNVLLITIDALAANDMSLYGYYLPTTPGLEAFAQSAYVFEHFYANSNWTSTSVTSLITGRYPIAHGVTVLDSRVRTPEQRRTLPAVLRERGYFTAAVTSNYYAHPSYLGIARDFDYLSRLRIADLRQDLSAPMMFWDSRLHTHVMRWWYGPLMKFLLPHLPQELRERNQFPADLVIETADAVLRDRRGPLFLWVHFFSPHEPYLPPAPFRRRFLDTDEFKNINDAGLMGYYDIQSKQQLADRMRLRYDEYVAYTDDAVSGWLRRLESSGVLDHCLVVIAADHGESFEKGWGTHGGPMLHQALIHVPLILRLPHQAGGARIASNAEQVDVLPTVLDLLEIPVPAWAQGESLAPSVREGRISDRPKFSEDLSFNGRDAPLERGNLAVIHHRHKLIHRVASGCEEFYDLIADPAESSNLLGADASRDEQLRQQLRQHTGLPLTPPTGDAGSGYRPCAVPWRESTRAH